MLLKLIVTANYADYTTGAMQTAVVLDEGGGLCNIYRGGLLGSKFQNAEVCTKAHYNRHLIGSYLRSANQASSFNACNVEASFTTSNW